MQFIRRVVESLKEKGLRETMKSAVRIVADYRFDLQYGTDTMSRVEVASMETDSRNKIHAQYYQASKTRPILKLFRGLQLPQGGVFVDLGCGKGRVLFLAAQLGFRKVVGIEFCARLCRQARRNTELFLMKQQAASPIEIIEADVTRYTFSGDETVFFLYNPFGAVILAKVLDAIARSARETPREFWIVYNNPVYHDLVLDSGLFAGYDRHEIEGEIFHVYHHRVAADSEDRKGLTV